MLQALALLAFLGLGEVNMALGLIGATGGLLGIADGVFLKVYCLGLRRLPWLVREPTGSP